MHPRADSKLDNMLPERANFSMSVNADCVTPHKLLLDYEPRAFYNPRDFS
jgi:hypothetical protein